jgi:maltose phosphorylase
MAKKCSSQRTNTKLYEQHEGFFNLPHIDIDAIPRRIFIITGRMTHYHNDALRPMC